MDMLSKNETPSTTQELISKTEFKTYHFLAILIIFVLIISNITYIKTSTFFRLEHATSSYFFPCLFGLICIVTEVYGFKSNMRIILLSIVVSTIFTFLLSFARILPSAPNIPINDSFNEIFNFDFYIFYLGTVCIWIGSYATSLTLSWTKVTLGGKQAYLRFLLASILGILVETFFFSIVVAFNKNIDFIDSLIASTIIKIIFQIVFLPLNVFVAEYIKKRTKINNFDYKIKYNIFSL
jgi:uncharacterized PurR-regulated membrane protein YhhQ (DUF165 family)